MCINSRPKNKAENKENSNRKCNSCSGRRGSITIAGIGPGDFSHITPEVVRAIKTADVVVGYDSYLKLIVDLTADKKVISSGMRKEVERGKAAVAESLSGKSVVVVSSGDPGVYGMAGLVLELLPEDKKKSVEVKILPGITAANASASLLGAPLMHDYAVISLSDLLTDRREILRRVKYSAKADFVIVFYNPASTRRRELFRKAIKIILRYRSGKTPVGIVRNAYRKEQKVGISSLKDLADDKGIDMVTTLIIGKSTTITKNGFMVTPRGYRIP